MQDSDTPYQDTRDYSPPWNMTTKLVVIVLLLVLVGLAWPFIRTIFAPVIIGAIVAYLFHPVAVWISRKTRLPRGVATAILFLILLGVVIPILISLAPVIEDLIRFVIDETLRFLSDLNQLNAEAATIELPGGFEVATQELVNEITLTITEFVRSLASEGINLVFDVAEIILLVIVTVLTGFYLTAQSDKFLELVEGAVPIPYRRDFEELLAELDGIWSGFFRGQFILALVVGTMMTVVSTIIGLPQPVWMGLLAGLMEFLPSIGHAIWFIIALIVALVEGSTTLPISNLAFALVVLGVYLAYTQFDLNFLIPRIIGGQVHLHPLVVILGIIVGARVGGVLGVALAAPTIASLRVFIRYIYAKLLDLRPFPMVGPPAAPREERLVEAERLAVEKSPTPLQIPIPNPGDVIGRVLGKDSEETEASQQQIEQD
jgi:predicted PurR-regulated permease PerM